MTPAPLLTQYRKFFQSVVLDFAVMRLRKASDVFYKGDICTDVATVKQSPTSAEFAV